MLFVKRIFYGALLALVFAAGWAEASLSVNPARVEAVVSPLGVLETAYTITSNYAAPVEITASVKNWRNSQENEKVDVNDWLKLQKDSFLLKPGETAEVRFTASVPKGAKGSLSAMISFKVNSAEISGINLIVSMPVHIIAEGTEVKKFKLSGLQMVKNREEGLQLGYTVENKGNIHLRPSGRAEIFEGKKAVQNKEISDTVPAYADLSRQYSVAFGSLEAGQYKLVLEIEASGKKVKKTLKFKVGADGTVK